MNMKLNYNISLQNNFIGNCTQNSLDQVHILHMNSSGVNIHIFKDIPVFICVSAYFIHLCMNFMPIEPL